MATLSGIFRDLLPLQTKLLAEAALLAAKADEPVEQNFIRKHALHFMAENGGAIEDAALRVFGNADGAYGANVNSLVGNGAWEEEDELADAYLKRKGFAYGVDGPPRAVGQGAGACAGTGGPDLSEPRTRSKSASPPSIITSTRWAASAAR